MWATCVGFWNGCAGAAARDFYRGTATEIGAARLLTYQAATLADDHQTFKLEASMAKLYASEVSQRATNAAVQVHGGYGYVEEYKVERFLREAKLTEIGEGTSQIQRPVSGRAVLGMRVA